MMTNERNLLQAIVDAVDATLEPIPLELRGPITDAAAWLQTRPVEPKVEPLVQWLVANVDDRDVPDDGGNADALLFNLVQLARHGRPYEKYAYKPEQDEEVARLRSSLNREVPHE